MLTAANYFSELTLNLGAILSYPLQNFRLEFEFVGADARIPTLLTLTPLTKGYLATWGRRLYRSVDHGACKVDNMSVHFEGVACFKCYFLQ